LPRTLKHSKKIGVIKTVAVYKKYQGFGIGNKLSQISYDELIDKGVDSLYSIAWRNGEVTNIGGILTNLGFKEHAVIENYWTEDSQEKGYDCPACGEPPCKCTGIIYTKAIYS
jgi:ribosomal protein S18 acetylase RimI-like enzyme